MRNSCVHDLQVDTYTLKVLEGLAALPAVTEVELSPEGMWRPVAAGAGSRPSTPAGAKDAGGAWYRAGDKAVATPVRCGPAPLVRGPQGMRRSCARLGGSC